MNGPEAAALIVLQLQECICNSQNSVTELMQLGKTLLGQRHISVPGLLQEIQVDGTFPNRQVAHNHLKFASFSSLYTTLSVPNPANFEAALYGSFLCIPPDSAFPIFPEARSNWAQLS
jgi:urease